MSKVIKLKEMEDEGLLKRIHTLLLEGCTNAQIADQLCLSKYKSGVLIPYVKRKFGEATPTNGTDKRDDVVLPEDFYLKVYMDFEGIETPRLSRAAIAQKYGLSKYKLEIAIDQGRFNFNALMAKPEYQRKYGGIVANVSKGDFSDYPVEVLIELQESIRDHKLTKLQAAEKMGWSRNKVDKLVALQIEYFKKGKIVSIAIKQHRLGDMIPASVAKFNGIPYFVVAQHETEAQTTVIDMSRISGLAHDIQLAHIQALLLLGKEEVFPSETVVTDADCASQAIEQIKNVLTGENFGEILLLDGSPVMVDGSSNFLSDFFITEIGGGQVQVESIDFEATRVNNETLKKRFSEERYKSRHASDNRNLEPKSCEGFRVFSTASQIQIIKITTGEMITVTKGSSAYDDVYRMLVRGENESAFLLASGTKDVSEYRGEHFEMTLAGGLQIKTELAVQKMEPLEKRVRHLIENADYAGLEAIDKFVGKMLQNPSVDIINRIPYFLTYGDVQICDDGDLYVYKAVNKHYRDDYTDSIDNSVGCMVFMERDRINPSTYVTCTSGLHVCSLDYVNQMMGYRASDSKIMRVKLNPADIVAIPNDYGNRKIRCCRYEVVEDVTIAYHSGKLCADSKGAFASA